MSHPHPPFPPLPTGSSAPLPPIAQRILHSLSTLTSPSQLPKLLSEILRHKLHHNTTVSSSFILSSILSHRSLSPALRLLSHLPRPHVFTCNSLLLALVPSLPHLVPVLFSHFLHSSVLPNNYTFPPLLKSLTLTHRQHHVAYSVHSRIVKSGLDRDVAVHCSLMSFYSSSGDILSCEQLFDEMPHRGVIPWTSLISSYKNSGMNDKALFAFERMQYAGVPPNRVTMVSALSACAAHGGTLETGVWIHDFIRRSGWVLDVVLGTALVDMYAKCGRIEDGLQVFLSMGERNVYTWNSLIGGLALAKSGKEALYWFSKMEEEGVRPDAVTLIGVLSACSHSGLVEEGRKIFESVASWSFGFYPGIKHYGCLVDLLGRAGCLDEAVRCIQTMPFEPGTVIWGSLLGGCRTHGELRLSEVAARRLVELEPENVVHYVLLSNLYVEMGRWWDAEEVRMMMKERGMRKDAGWSLAESDKDHADRFRCWEIANVENASSIPEESYDDLLHIACN